MPPKQKKEIPKYKSLRIHCNNPEYKIHFYFHYIFIYLFYISMYGAVYFIGEWKKSEFNLQ